MVKNNRMKKLFFIQFFLLPFLNDSFCQYSNIPIPLDCRKINTQNFPQGQTTINNFSCIEAPGTVPSVSINGSQAVEFISSEGIQLKSGFHASGFNNDGSFRAKIAESNLDIAIYTPQNYVGQVPKYEKLEIGIELPDAIMEEIKNFTDELSGNKLNPFNPEQVDVKAEFYTLNSGANPDGDFQTSWTLKYNVFGFYYEDFFEDISGNVHQWSIADLPTEHHFRVRFAPPEIGFMACKITVVVLNYGTYEILPFYFEVIPSTNHGYVKVGPNKRYLELDGETYFTAGINMPQPDCACNEYLNMSDCIAINHQCDIFDDPAVNYDERKQNPTYHLTYRDEILSYKNAGGKEFRMMTYGDFYEIEFEKLNNYTERLNTAWEFDQIVNLCNAEDMMLYWNLQNHENFIHVSDGTRLWDWPSSDDVGDAYCYTQNGDMGYCYRTADPNIPVMTPTEFLTNSEARKFYQYRLRYISSRWGYSTNISVFELKSESNHHSEVGHKDNNSQPPCKHVQDYIAYSANDNGFLSKLASWQNEMCQYLKTHQYFPHLTAVDYTGNPAGLIPVNAPNSIIGGDYSYYSPYVDIAAWNHYEYGYKRIINETSINNLLHSGDNNVPLLDKPILISENGQDTKMCDEGIEFIRDTWCSTFTGNASSAKNWKYQQYYHLFYHLRNIEQFVSGVNLDDSQGGPWVPQYNERADKLVATYALVSNEFNKRAFGVIENRTVNSFTMNSGLNNKCDNEDDIPDLDPFYNNEYRSNIVVYPNSYNLVLSGMGYGVLFNIDWYDIFSLNLIQSQNAISSNNNLILNFPTLSDDMSRPLLAFKIYENGEPPFLIVNIQENNSSLIQPDTSGNEQVNNIALFDEINVNLSTNILNENSFNLLVYPNPSNSEITIEFSVELTNTSLTIFNSLGEIIFNVEPQVNSIDVDINNLVPGTYYIQLISEQITQIKRLIKL